MLPGASKPVVVRMYLASVNGDKPALYTTMGYKKGQCIRGCQLCCYCTRRGSVTFNPKKQFTRDFNVQVKVQALVEGVLDRQINKIAIDQQINIAFKKAVGNTGWLAQWGLREQLPVFYGIPTAYPKSEDFYRCFIRDIFHDFDAGLFGAILQDGLQLIECCCKERDGILRTTRNKANCATGIRVNACRPELRHVDHFTWKKGIVDLILGTSDAKANKGSTGSSGGMRSSWTKGMIDRVLLAIGDGCDILPTDDEFRIRKHSNNGEPGVVIVKNPAKLVCMTFYAALDVYYDFLRDKWNEELVKNIAQKVRRLQSLHTVLHHNVVTATRTATKEQEYEVNKSVFNLICLSIDKFVDRVIFYIRSPWGSYMQ